MARRIVNRKEKRAEVEAFERRKDEDETEKEEGEDEDEEEDAEEEEEAEAGEAAGAEDGAEGDEEEAPKKKKKEPKPKAKPKAKAKPRTRTPKIVRMKVVWGVFNNSNQRVATYEYPQRKAADEHAAKLMTDKRTTHFVQPVKEPIEVKKEE
ncbi:MAG TPA: hypothetical protein VGG61_11545 [Gemmataceae bacterium]|jgi:hypothetical protein